MAISLRNVEKILVIKLRAIGDVVLATPVIANLRQAFPEAEIDFLTEKACYPIVKEHPDLDDVVVFDRAYIENMPFYKGALQNLRFFKALRQKKYDLVFDLFGNPRSALFTRITGARYRVGFNFRGRKYAYNIVVPARGNQVHEVIFNLDALSYVGIPIQTQKLYITINDINAAFADEYWQSQKLPAGRTIGINPAGGWYTKRWPLEKFAELGDRLAEELAAKVLLLWGPGEFAEVKKVAQQMRHKPIISPQTDLQQLAAILRKLDVLVSNDSGPMHLAAAVGTKVVGIYGPTRPDLQGPWGNGHYIVRKENLACLGCNGVTCRIQTHDCMQKLEVGQVFETVRAAMGDMRAAAEA